MHAPRFVCRLHHLFHLLCLSACVCVTPKQSVCLSVCHAKAVCLSVNRAKAVCLSVCHVRLSVTPKQPPTTNCCMCMFQPPLPTPRPPPTTTHPVCFRLLIHSLAHSNVPTRATTPVPIATPSFRYMRELYQMPWIGSTVNMQHIKVHYFTSHAPFNTFSVVPVGPGVAEDLLKPHGGLAGILMAHCLLIQSGGILAFSVWRYYCTLSATWPALPPSIAQPLPWFLFNRNLCHSPSLPSSLPSTAASSTCTCRPRRQGIRSACASRHRADH